MDIKRHKATAGEEDSGKRLDIFLADFSRAQALGISRNVIQQLIRGGGITLAGAALKPHYKVRPGDEFIITAKSADIAAPAPEDIPLDLVYEDDDLVVVNKPAGLVVHPGAGRPDQTLVNALLYRVKTLSEINPQRPGIVHRLDKDTSGLLVAAKNNQAHLALAKQFARHSIKRVYVAVVAGRMEFDEDIIEASISRHPLKRKDMAVGFGKDPRYAKTRYRTLKRTGQYSVLELEPFTGRTHQLRVHLAFIGHPIMGDVKYGKHNQAPRLYLHARTLGFIHPRSGKYMEFSSELPEEIRRYM